MDRKFMLDLNDNTKMIDLEPLKSASYKFYFGSLKKKYQNLNFKIISDEKKLMETPKNDHPYIILIILELKKNYKPILLSYLNLLYDNNEIDDVIFFIENLDNINKINYNIWFNLNGRKLVEFICNQFLDKRLPQDILNKFNNICPNIFNQFISLEIQFYCENKINIKHSLVIMNNNSKINLTLYYPKNYKLDKLFLNKLIYRSFILSEVNDIHKTLNINLWLTNFKKEFTSHYKTLGPKEINSGSSGGISDSIDIWRLEELPKVLMHEIYHNLDLDSKMYQYSDLVNFIKKTSDIGSDTKILINEAVTEISAILTNSIISTLEIYKNKDDSFLYSKFLDFLELERRYSIFQVSKILLHFGYDNAKDFFTPNKKKFLFKQTTSVFSYFIVKTAILFNLDVYLDFMLKNFRNLKVDLNKKRNLETLILELIYDELFILKINNTMKIIKNKDFSPSIKNTLRMSCVSS